MDPPFNRFSFTAKGKFKNNLEDYYKMVGHSLYSQSDNLLRVWGIDYAKQNGVGAAIEPEYYVMAFEAARDVEIEEGTKNSVRLFELLIEAFSFYEN